MIKKKSKIVKFGTIIVLFMNIFMIKSSRGCPQRSVLAPCTCHDVTKGFEITCEGVWPRENLYKVFHNLKSGTDFDNSAMYLKLKDTNLSTLPAELFDKLEIRHLMAHKCSIQNIEYDTFLPLKDRIESIDLSENILAQVPQALNNLTSLLSLNLNFNSIQTLHNYAFQGLDSLVRLSLFGNQIHTIYPASFSGFSGNLTRINLGGNRLTNIPTEALRPLRSLQVSRALFSCSRNKIF